MADMEAWDIDWMEEVMATGKLCSRCFANYVAKNRLDLGYTVCLACGEYNAQQVAHCIVPMNKSNYIVVTDKTVLTQLNPKRV